MLGTVICWLCLGLSGPVIGQATPPDSLVVPAYTAFVTPDQEGTSVSEQDGVTGWASTKQSVFWVGKFAQPGTVHVSIDLQLPAVDSAAVTLEVGGKRQTRTIHGTDNGTVTADFGDFPIPASGYQKLSLRGVTRSGASFGTIKSVRLSGPAAEHAHFNLRPEQRGAPSVHLRYPTPSGASVSWFYNEVTVKADPVASYYMACGWHRGYFGIQVNSPTERRIIFSVWDSGKEPTDRNKVGADDRVQLLAKGDGVVAESFGNEGTGGHSHMVYPWKTGKTYRFLVSAEPQGDATVYSGYFFFPDRKAWGLIARFRAPKDGSYLRSLYSFDEDFWGDNGYLRRDALFGPVWIRTTEGSWQPLTDAVFTHTGKDWRSDYDARAQGSGFELSCGGFRDGAVKYGDHVRTAAPTTPPTVTLPATP